jgi:hypothetical protein
MTNSDSMTPDAPRTQYPRWIGLGGWTGTVRHGFADLITAPGHIEKSVKCAHSHRTPAAARKCGQDMAERRNARLAEAQR